MPGRGNPGHCCSCPSTTQRPFGAAVPAQGGCKCCKLCCKLCTQLSSHSHFRCTTFTHTALPTNQPDKSYFHLQCNCWHWDEPFPRLSPVPKRNLYPLLTMDLKRLGFFCCVRFCFAGVRFPLLNQITNTITHFMAQELWLLPCTYLLLRMFQVTSGQALSPHRCC